MRAARAEQARRDGLYRAVWEVTRRHWTAGGLPDKPEHVNWLAPTTFELGAGQLVPDRMEVPLPVQVRPNFDNYREHLAHLFGEGEHAPARLDLLVLPDRVIVTPDRLQPRLLPDLIVYDDAPWTVPFGDAKRGGVHVWNPAEMFPHLLCAGLTGFGKTTFASALLLSLLRLRAAGVPTDIRVCDPKRFALEAFRNDVQAFAPDPVPADVRLALANGRIAAPDDDDPPPGWIAAGWAERLELAKLQQIADVIHAVYEESVLRQAVAGDRRGAQRLIWQRGRLFLVIEEAIALLQFESMTGTSPAARAAQARDALRKQAVSDLGQIGFMGREVGVQIVVFTQRADVTVIPGPFRAQLVGRLAFRLDAEGSRMVTNTDLAFNSLPLTDPGRYWMIAPRSSLGWEQGQGFNAPEDFIEGGLRALAA